MSLFCATAWHSSSSQNKMRCDATDLNTGRGRPGGMTSLGGVSWKSTAAICLMSISGRDGRGPKRGAFGVCGLGAKMALPSLLLELVFLSTEVKHFPIDDKIETGAAAPQRQYQIKLLAIPTVRELHRITSLMKNRKLLLKSVRIFFYCMYHYRTKLRDDIHYMQQQSGHASDKQMPNRQTVYHSEVIMLQVGIKLVRPTENAEPNTSTHSSQYHA
jgi:hypothetical protein